MIDIHVIREWDLSNPFLQGALQVFQKLNEHYDNVNEWILRRLIPGFAAGMRTILYVEFAGRPAAAAILKHEEFEKKICSLVVLEEYSHHGVGAALFQKAFEIMGTDKPVVTVDESVYPQFEHLFERFGFVLKQKYKDWYRKGSTELCFNGYLFYP